MRSVGVFAAEWMMVAIQQRRYPLLTLLNPLRFRLPAADVADMDVNVEILANLSVSRLAGPDEIDRLTPEWELLEQQIFPRTPFTSPLWLGLWWKHLRRRNITFHDQFFCHVVRDVDGRLVAIAPLMQTSFPGLGPPLVRIAQFFGTDPSITELRGVICRPQDHDTVVRALVEHFLRHRNEWGLFRWNGLRRSAPTYNALAIGCRFIERRALPDYVLDLPRNWDDLKARVSSNMRKNLRKAYEFLERDGFRFDVRVVERPDEMPAAIDRFLALHALRANAAQMINHPNKFARPPERGFLVDYLTQLAARDQVRIFELAIDGGTVASRLTFLLGDELYLYFAGYDPDWKAYSVMTLLVSEIFKWAMARGVQRINLSTGSDQSKLRWRPQEILYHDGVQVSPTLRGRLAYRAFLAYEALAHRRDVARRGD